MILKITADSPEQTQTFARHLASKMRGGEILQLKGDVGAGKTTFTAGLVEGLESDDHVSSPTFTICNHYHGRLEIFHCDFYRLHDDELIENELAEILDGEAVVVLEWAEDIKSIEQADVLEVKFSTLSESARLLEVSIPLKYRYITQ